MIVIAIPSTTTGNCEKSCTEYYISKKEDVVEGTSIEKYIVRIFI